MADDHIDKKIKTAHASNIDNEAETNTQVANTHETVHEAENDVASAEEFEDERLDEEDSDEDEVEEEDDGGLPQHMFLSLPYLPADGPRGRPHVIDLSQREVVEAIRQDKYALSRLDIIATILYNHKEPALKDFLDTEHVDYIEFRAHRYEQGKDGAIKELPSLLIVRRWEFIFTAHINNNEDVEGVRKSVVYDRYRWHSPVWRRPLDLSRSWHLQTYDSRCYSRDPWQIVQDNDLEERQMQGSTGAWSRIPEDQNTWMLDFGAGQDLLDQCWKNKKGKAGDHSCRDVSLKRRKRVNLLTGGWYPLSGLMAEN